MVYGIVPPNLSLHQARMKNKANKTGEKHRIKQDQGQWNEIAPLRGDENPNSHSKSCIHNLIMLCLLFNAPLPHTNINTTRAGNFFIVFTDRPNYLEQSLWNEQTGPGEGDRGCSKWFLEASRS